MDQSERTLVKADFDYNETDNTFTCPGGQILAMKQETKDGKRVYCRAMRRFAGRAVIKAGAANPAPDKPARSTPIIKNRRATDEYQKAATEAAKAVYKKRKVVVEPVFGQIKNSGFRRFSVRGKEKTAGEFSLLCATHNIKKIARSIIRGFVCPEFGKWATSPA